MRVRRRWLCAGILLGGCPADDVGEVVAEGTSFGSATGSTGTPSPGTTGPGVDTSDGGSTASPQTGTDTTGSDDTAAGPSAVSGVLEGLQGAMVQLRNGKDVIDLDHDGPFGFPGTVDNGEDYAVEVSVQPVGPDQTCTVYGGSGTAAGVDIDDIVVRCVTPIRHVVVLGIDGLGASWVDSSDMPALDALREQSAWSLQMQNTLPTSSSTNWMSMINGVTAQEHGVLSNGWQPGDSSPPPTMFAALREAEPEATIGVFHDWTDFARLIEPDIVDHIEHPGDEQDTMDAATAWLETETPRLLFIHLDHVDHAGHLNTWGSDAYASAVEDADGLLAQLQQSLEDAGMWPYTALLVSSDHGGTAFSHGADTRAERTIPFILRTPQGGGAEGGLQIDRRLRIWDIPATVLALLNVEAPKSWLASPVVEGLYDSEFGLPPAPASATGRALVDPVWVYDDTGTGASSEVSLWRPVVPEGYGLLGDLVVEGYRPPTAPAIALVDDPEVVRPPVGFELVWQDTGSGGVNDVSIWSPVAPLGFVCMGAVAVPGYSPPEIGQLRCVHQSLVQPALSALTWDDAGSGAAWDASLWSCIPGGADDPAAEGLAVGAFTARRHGDDPGFNVCATLRPDAVTLER